MPNAVVDSSSNNAPIEMEHLGLCSTLPAAIGMDWAWTTTILGGEESRLEASMISGRRSEGALAWYG
jgi:hypothetical protein